MIVALMMGRKGSKGFPGKNLHKVNGHPLAYYPMAIIKNSPLIDCGYLSTDDPELMKLAKDNGLNVIERPPELCIDSALGDDVYHHAYEYVKNEIAPEKVELLILLMCNAPLISRQLVEDGINKLREKPDLDSAVSVSCYNMWSPLRARKETKDGTLEPFVPFETFGDPKSLNCDRDSQGSVWFADMGVSVIRPHCMENLEDGLLPQKWMGHKIWPLKQEAGLDVDYEWQLPQVEWWLKNKNI